MTAVHVHPCYRQRSESLHHLLDAWDLLKGVKGTQAECQVRTLIDRAEENCRRCGVDSPLLHAIETSYTFNVQDHLTEKTPWKI